GWSALACLLLFISQLSYETALAVPGLCVLVDLLRRRTILSRDAILRYAALGLVTLAYLIVRNALGATLSFEERNSSFSPDLEAWHMTLSAPWFLWKHFTMWLMPFGRLEFLGTYVWAKSASPMHLAAAWVWLLVMIAACGLAWKRRPLIAIGVLWFLVASFPTSNLIPVWNGPIVDYYLMLPSIGLVMALVGILRWLLDFLKQAMGPAKAARRRAVACALGMVIIWRLAMVPLFWFQAGLWDDPLKLYLHAEATRPYQYQLQTAIAQELLVSGQLEQAKLYANLAREGGPWSPASYLVLGTIALEQGEPEKAQNHFTQVLKRSYSGSFIHDYSRLNLGKAVMLGGGRPEQVHEILLPLLREPNADQHIEAIQVLVDANLKHARTDAAARALRRALELHPEKQEFRLQLEALQSGDDP
ncbi:MAG: hypothetical protein R3242_03140, partial [Akkermansiaceae bacterium]|nr:hypothetical protein [Akkermansiaceae bacterium]